MLWATRLHSKHFTHAFQWSVLCVNVHICASEACTYTRRECACVWVCRMTVVWNLTRGPVGFMKGLFHVPFPSGVRLESSCLNQVLPYGKYLLGYSRILNRPFCEWAQNTVVAYMCYGVSQTPAACGFRQEIDTLSSCFSHSFPIASINSKLKRNPYEIA